MHFGYGNILESGSVTITSEAAGYPKYRLYDKDVSLPWKATSAVTQTIETQVVMAWDLLDESFANLDDWTNQDAGNGVSEISPAGELRLDGNTAAATNYARQIQDIGSFPNTFTLQTSFYHDLIGPRGPVDYCVLRALQVDERLHVFFSTDGIEIYDTTVGGWTEVGTDLVKSGGTAEQQVWRLNVTFGTLGAGVCDVYLYDSTHNWEKVGSAIPCSQEGSYTEGHVELLQYGQTTNDMLTHIDYIKAATGIHLPASTINRMIITGHNLSCAKAVRLNYSDNGSDWTEILAMTPSNNDPINCSFDTITHEFFKVTIEDPSLTPEIGELYLGNSIEIIGYPVERVQVSSINIRTRRETQSGVPWIIEEGPTKGSFNCNLNGLTDVQKGYILTADSEGFFFFIDHNGILWYVESKTKPNVVRVAADWFDVGVDLLEVDQI